MTSSSVDALLREARYNFLHPKEKTLGEMAAEVEAEVRSLEGLQCMTSCKP